MRSTPAIKPLLTILVIFHREGYIAHPTLRSAVVAVEEAARNGIDCQIVAVIDRGDANTRNCIQRFSNHLAAVHEVDFGELSASRNYGIERIESKYVATLDGDDCVDRDWLWKGVCFLEECGEVNVVAHPELRLSFGTELHGRLQISTDSYLFHPLNLISSWHYAADIIMPTRLYKKYPQLPNDHQNGLGAEDWHWTCESVVEGIRHVIVPGTCSFYRRQAGHVSLGMLPSIIFPPTRLFDKERVEAYNEKSSSTGIRFAGSLDSVTGAMERWSQVPHWVEQSVRNACDLDFEFYKVYNNLKFIPFETPAFFPAVGQLYLHLLSQVSGAKSCIIFVCDRLESLNLGLIDSFLAVHRQSNELELDILILALTESADRRASATEILAEVRNSRQVMSQERLRYVDLGNEPGFIHSWWRQKQDVIVRFLMQTHPDLVVNLTSKFFDQLIADFGKAIASVGTRTIRICPGENEKATEAMVSWWHLTSAGGNYTTALCENAGTRAWLSAGFKGTDTQLLTCKASQGFGSNSAYSEALYGLLIDPDHAATVDSQDEIDPVASFNEGDIGKVPDVTCIMTVQNEGHYLNATLRSVAIMCVNAASQGLSSELIVIAHKAGSRTSKVLETLAEVWTKSRVVVQEEQDIGKARNAGIEMARGRFIAMLTGSSLVSPAWLYQAVQLAKTHGPKTIVHPHAVVEFGEHLRTQYQPGVERPDLLASEQVWTVHALARRDLFRQIPYRSLSFRSGYGHSVWHWNCETVMAGVRHMVVENTAVYCRGVGFVGEQNRILGAISQVTLPPTPFFTEHSWLTDIKRTQVKNPRTMPREWNDDAYLLQNPDVEKAVLRRKIRAGYDHFMLRGHAEGRTPCWYATHLAGSKMQATAEAIRSFIRYRWFARIVWHCRNIRERVLKHGIKELVSRPQPDDSTPKQWNENTYLQENPSAAQAVADKEFLTGYEHYCNCGRADGLGPHWEDQDLHEAPEFTFSEIPEEFPLPGWMDQETRLFASFEPAFKRTVSGSAVLERKRVLPTMDVYRTCWKVVAPIQPTHIIILELLRTGGAELSAFHTMEALVSSPDHRVLVITTATGDNRWQDRLPDGCTWLPYGAIAANCHYEQRIEVLTRILINSGARCLHISYAWLGWEILKRHAAALADRMRLFVSVFSIPSPGFNEDSGPAGLLPPLIPHLAGVLTDNKCTAEQLCTVSGLDAKQVKVLRHPAPVIQRFPEPSQNCNTVLWASRIDREKRPDLLMQIAGLLPGVEFHVYGKNVLGNDDLLEQLKAVPNIKYCGPFSGFETIQQVPYTLFLYTSIMDGLPNVLLEAMKSGLLVVASDVGGISEVVRDDTGILIRDFDNAAAYARMIRDVLKNPGSYRERAEAGREFIAGNFTKSAFLESLQLAPQYL